MNALLQGCHLAKKMLLILCFSKPTITFISLFSHDTHQVSWEKMKKMEQVFGVRSSPSWRAFLE
jgi:hypothetical protein